MFNYVKTHKLFTGIGVLIIVAISWFALSGGNPSSSAENQLLGTSSLPASASGNATVAGVDRELQDTLDQVRAIQLNDPILSDPAFLSLQDFGQQIVPEPFGRPIPFAPISGTVKK